MLPEALARARRGGRRGGALRDRPRATPSRRRSRPAGRPTTSPSPPRRPSETWSSRARRRVPGAGPGRLDRPGDERDSARGRPRGRTSRPSATTPTGSSRRCSPTPRRSSRDRPTRVDGRRRGLPITFLSDYGTADEFAGRLPRGDRPDRPGSARDRLDPRDRPPAVRQGAPVLARARSPLLAGGGPPRRRRSRGRDRRGERSRWRPARRAADPRRPRQRPPGPAVERLGGAADAVDVSRRRFRLEPVSATFHGRDLFAPVAAHLALGMPLAEPASRSIRASLDPLAATSPELDARRRSRHVSQRRPFRQRRAGPSPPTQLPRDRAAARPAARVERRAAPDAGRLHAHLRRRRAGRAARLRRFVRVRSRWR